VSRRREAWGHRDEGRQTVGPPSREGYDPPHWVDWPPGSYAGKALCGKDIVPLRIDPLGTAALVDVRVCPGCASAAEATDRASGQVVDLAARRVQRKLW